MIIFNNTTHIIQYYAGRGWGVFSTSWAQERKNGLGRAYATPRSRGGAQRRRGHLVIINTAC